MHKKKNTIFLFDEKFPHSTNTRTIQNQVEKFRYKFHASTTKHVFILFEEKLLLTFESRMKLSNEKNIKNILDYHTLEVEKKIEKIRS